MGKLTYQSAKEELPSAKEERDVAKQELQDFLKANKLKKGEDHSKNPDKKIAKGFKAVKELYEGKQKRVETLISFIKENKPAPSERESKYNYPKGVETSADKKKFRSIMRGKAKKAGVSLDKYLADPAKYAAKVAEAEQKAGPAPKKKAAAEKEEKPVKKLKVLPKTEEKPVKKLLKKKTPVEAAPAEAAASSEESSSED